MRAVDGRVLACVLVLAPVGACAAAPGGVVGSPPPPPAVRQGPSHGVATTEDNVAATRELSSWLLHAVPMPPGAREWHRSPTAHYRRGTIGIGPSDHAFMRTTWWTVPLPSAELGAWLRNHAPQGLVGDPDAGPSQSGGVWEEDQDFRAPSTSAHTRGWVNFAYTPASDGVVVRVDTFVGARFARTVLVPTDTRSVTVQRTVRAPRPRARPHATTRTITDPAVVARLVALVNGLPGAMTTPFVASCPPVIMSHSYRLTFTAPQGSYVATLPTTSCWPSVTLTLDGAVAGPPLDPGTRFARVVDRLLS